MALQQDESDGSMQKVSNFMADDNPSSSVLGIIQESVLRPLQELHESIRRDLNEGLE